MISSPNETVQISQVGAVVTITINRPDSLNAINDDVVSALIEITAALRSEPGVRCVVLTGSGKHFMAGGDVKRFHRKFETAADDAETEAWFNWILGRIHTVVENLNAIPVPVIAGVKGAVAGAGFSLMLGCDLVVAADDCIFTLAYCHLGTSPDGGSTWTLPRAVGLKRAMEIALLGDRFGAEQALQWGLINRVVAADALAGDVEALSARLASGPTAALARTKRLLLDGGIRPLGSQLDAETESFVACAMSPDFREGVRAFVEKRKPAFTGTEKQHTETSRHD